MTPEEVLRFRQNPWFADIIAVRLWDEAAKDPGARDLSPSHFHALIVRHLQQNIL
jgi:predicted HD phosphohydrolase